MRQIDFKGFMRIANAYRGVGMERFGEPITVNGKPAFYVEHNSQYVRFAYPDSEQVLNSHPLDVLPIEARRGTPYFKQDQAA